MQEDLVCHCNECDTRFWLSDVAGHRCPNCDSGTWRSIYEDTEPKRTEEVAEK